MGQSVARRPAAQDAAADFGISPRAPGGSGAGGVGDVADLECATSKRIAGSPPSSGRSGHLLPPGEKEKPSSAETSVAIALFPTPCGWMGIAGRNETVHLLRLGYTDPDDLRAELTRSHPQAAETDWFPELRRTLEAYAAGERVSLTKFRYHLPDLTDFQQQVLRFVHRIPYGQVLSYGEVAAKVGCPGAARAVGTVMANNCLPLIIPCHRVIAAGGKLGGYSSPRGPGLKQWLLDLEQADLPKRLR